MRRTITRFKSLMLLTAAACFMQANAHAATYVAQASGNFSSTATWTGGIIPPALLPSGDEIIIPLTFTVTMDQNQSIGSSSTLTVNGTLQAASGYYVSMTSGTIAGLGNIELDSFYADFTSGFAFAGNFSANTYASSNTAINTVANVTIHKTLRLMGGTFDMASGSLMLDGNAKIIVSGGTMTATGGTINLTNSYDVIYTTQATTAGMELSGSGLQNVTVDIPASSSINLSSDLDVNGTLMLNSGMLSLNNHNLTFMAGGNLSNSGSGSISSSSNSDITINSTAGLSSAIKFSQGGNTVDDFTINLGSGSSTVSIDGDLMVDGQLSLQSGRLNIGSNNLELMTNATVTGGSSGSYVVTGTGGTMSIEVATNSSQTFHVGTEDDYAPSVITATSGSANSTFSVGVNGTVMQDGTTGASVANANQPIVDATWFIASSATANVNVDIETHWSTNMEVNSFDRSKAYISHYTNGEWDTDASAAATMSGSGMYSIKRTGVSSFSPFAVFDENTKVSVYDIAANNNISLHPNPATNNLTIELGEYTGAAHLDIYNTSGQVVYSSVLESNAQNIDVSALAPGMYYISIADEDNRGMQKFVKQ